MKTKLLLSVLALVGTTVAGAATNDPRATLERGLFEEEANHNLPAAIQAYQSVVNQFDQDRKLAATAVFRLGECYRRQGKTNEASAQYERVLREFADQAPLLELSRENLAGLGIKSPAGSISIASEAAARQEQKRLLGEEVDLVEKKLEAQRKQIEVGAVGQDALWPTQRELLELKRQIAALDSGAPITIPLALGGAAPSTSSETEEVRRIQAMIKDSPDLINAKDKSGKTPLHVAAAEGELIVADFLLRNGADINARDHLEATPLFEAAASGHKAMVELLLQHKAELEQADGRGWTPLGRAAEKGFISVVQVLLEHGANPNAKAKDGSTPLHAAIGVERRAIVDALLAQKADVNAANDEGTTPLHIAAARGLDTIARQLVDHGATIDSKDKLGWTPLVSAVEQRQIPTTKLLLALKADPNVEFQRDRNFKQVTSPLRVVVSSDNLELSQLLLTAGANPNAQIPGTYTPLFIAVYDEKKSMVALLLKERADPNLPDAQGQFALHFAVREPSVMELLLSGKATVNATTKRGETPLYWAVGAGLKPAAELLLSHNADPNLQDKDGLAPLHLAVLRANKDLVNLLLAHGADPNIRNNDGKTPLDWTKSSRSFQTDTPLQGIELPRPLRMPGFPSPGLVAQPMLPGARPLNNSEPERAGIMTALKSHGAVDELPDFSSIRVTRQGWNQPYVVFQSSTNGLNRFTLLEAIRFVSDHGWPGPHPLSLSPFGSLSFPDFSKIIIHRPKPTQPARQVEIRVNLRNESNGLDCNKDVPLEFGDVIEIPEREHSLAETPIGLMTVQQAALATCLSRKVEFTVKGQTKELTLTGSTGDSYLSQAMRLPAVQSILLSSSDLSAVHIKRTDPNAQPKTALDENVKAIWDHSQELRNDIWLRDGDVVEVPERP